jgi:hypothetical protein
MEKFPISIDTDLPELQFESVKIASNELPLEEEDNNTNSEESTTIADFVEQIRSQ